MTTTLELPLQESLHLPQHQLELAQTVGTEPIVGSKELYPGVHQSLAQVSIEFAQTKERLKLYRLGVLALSSSELQKLGVIKV